MSSFFSAKKILLVGFISVLLLVIPLTVYLLQKQQETRSRATPATKLYFSPQTTQNTTVGQKVNLDIYVDPGTNQISFAKLTISYDDKKLTLANDGLAVNPIQNKLSNILEGPTLVPSSSTSPAAVSITLSVGADPTAVIQTATKIATITFTAKDTTDTTGTAIKFVTAQNQTQILSIGASDQSNENVLLLSSLSPATIVIGAATINPSLTPSPTATPSSSTTSANPSPVCTGFNLDRSSTGIAPYSIAFTAIGNDTNGTVSRVTFNFGDGSTQEVTSGGGIGAASIQVQIAHTYKNPGTYKAGAILTDNNGAVSDSATCTQTITVNSSTGTAGQATGGTVATNTPTVAQTQIVTPSPKPPVTLPPTGPANSLVTAGVVGTILSIIGTVLLFSL